MKKHILIILLISFVTATSSFGENYTVYYKAENGTTIKLSEVTDQTPEMTEAELDELYTQIMGVLDELFTTIANRDLEKAVTYFLSIDREMYRKSLAQINDLSDEQLEEMKKHKMAEYRIVKATRTFAKIKSESGETLKFAIDSDGKWKMFY